MASKENQVGSYYKTLLDSKNIAYNKVAELSGVSVKTVDIFLHDRKPIAYKSLVSILDAITKLLTPQQENGQSSGEQFLASRVEKIMKKLPEDLQWIIHDQARALENLNSLRPPRVHDRTAA